MRYKKKKNRTLLTNIITIIVLLCIMIISITMIVNRTKTENTISNEVSTPKKITPIQAKILVDDIPEVTTVTNEDIIEVKSKLDTATVSSDYYKYLNPNDINGKNVMVYDKTNNKIIYQKDVDSRCYPASTTKIMTCIVALEYVSPDTIFTVGDELTLVPPDSSLAYISIGERISLHDLLYGLMLPSGNDVGYTIAVNVARIVSGDSKMSNEDSIKYFAKLMNKMAERIGMENSNFIVPDGFHDSNHYVTTKDMMKLLLYTDNYPLIKEVSSTYKYEVTVESGQDYIWINSNRLIDKSNIFYYEGVTTGKTGFHDDAGHCIAFICNKNGIELYVVIMNAQTSIYRNRDALNLLNMVYNPSEIKIGDAWDINPDETTTSSSENFQTGDVEGF